MSSRREILKTLAGVPSVSLLKLIPLPSEEAPHNAVNQVKLRTSEGAYVPRFFNNHEYSSLRVPGQTPDQLESLRRKLITRRSNVSPNRGGRGKVGFRFCEGFNGQPTVVTYLPQRRQNPQPVDLPRARNTAVIFGDVNMPDIPPYRTYCERRLLLFNICVEGVTVNWNVGRGDFADQSSGILQGVEKIGLKPVKGLRHNVTPSSSPRRATAAKPSTAHFHSSSVRCLPVITPRPA
jgi:hypothetical protein